ncbi:hypothetical protein Pint_20097 [Pistacia integerrima]|uniref:Uncharacterized protein n=1 Tax=Pistacia integerrima TaxID=434235 RepID=A0ACC0XE41_9ROSI|nr:hypothetical protein Pint_20097 [Pistacia integerrima]
MRDGSSKNQQEVINKKKLAKDRESSEMLRGFKENSGCYDLIVISVGPYHHGNPELELMQQHKHIMTYQYVNGNSKLLEELFRRSGAWPRMQESVTLIGAQ